MSLVAHDIARLHALRSIKSNLLRLKWLVAATRFELAFTRYDGRSRPASIPTSRACRREAGREGGGRTEEEQQGLLAMTDLATAPLPCPKGC